MTQPRPPTIVQVRTNLGLVPGVERLGDVLIDAGLAAAVGARRGPVLEAPAYSPERRHPSGLLNVDGIVDVALRQAGDDSVLFGSLLALRRRGHHGLVFIDAHIDFYPPEQSPTGEASDSELYLAFGFGPDVISDLDGQRPLVRSDSAAVLGHRDMEEQRDVGADLRATGALVVSLADLRERGMRTVAQEVRRHLYDAGVDGFLIHVDADVLDDALMPAVDYRIPDGLSGEEFSTLVGAFLADDRATALDVTVYNPALDPDGSAGRNLTDCLVAAFARE
jgi:arginase